MKTLAEQLKYSGTNSETKSAGEPQSKPPITELEVARRRIPNRLIDYVRYLDPQYCVGAVHRKIAEYLEAVAQGRIRRLILTCPPRHGKSRLVTLEFPTWLAGKRENFEVASASYSAKLAVDNCRKSMWRVRSPRYRWLFPHVTMRQGKQSADDWATETLFRYRACGIGGSLTGQGADLLIIDDPLKDAREANSPTIRKAVWEWYTTTAFTRLSPRGAIIVIMTRWHPDDLVGRLLDPAYSDELRDYGMGHDKWHVLNLPALAKENDPLGRKPGEALFPERFSAEKIRSIRASIGSRAYSALYEQSPVPDGGNYINPANFMMVGLDEVPSDVRLGWYWDVATKADKLLDYTVGIKGAYHIPTGNLFLLEMRRGQWNWAKTKAVMKETAERDKVLVGIEAVAGFKVAYQEARAAISPDVMVLEVGVATDKLTRALPWIAKTEAKKIFLVRGEWNGDFKNECEAFPGGKHDDQVDAVSGLHAMLANHRKLVLV